MPASVSFDRDLASQVYSTPPADEPEELDDTQNTCTYPVLSLPPEIVSTIFENFLPTYPERPPPLGIFSPLFLCRICQQWRRIAICTPTLWRAIEMEFREEDTERAEIMDSRICLLETWLSRSGDCPLSLSLCYRPSDTHPTILLAQFVRAVVLRCQRWEHIELQMPLEHLHLIQGDMPLLRHLTFGPSDLPPDGDPRSLTLFDRAPQLTDVTLTECFVPEVVHLPWAQITRLEGRCLYERECSEILTHTNQLIHCSLTLCDSSELDIRMSALPILPHLRHLDLGTIEFSSSGVKLLLEILTLPALQTLKIWEPALGADPVGDLKMFVSRSRCTLHELHVDGSSVSESAYRQALPSIQLIVLRP
ncbi:hypothetical protein B0H11DRAFT_1116728 [Mycena galericulata]|nr:hypothetical protein B0H11DRAFT_1116728 [Mycena galericulata]